MLREVIIFLIFFFQVNRLFADCFFDKFENQQPGIFLRPFGNDTIIFNPTGSFRIPEEGYVQVYCFSGIENQEKDEWGSPLSEDGEKVKNLTIHCNKHKLDYKVADRSKVRANTKIRCGGTNANFYKNVIEYCPYEGFVYGLPIMERSIVLLELCFDFYISDFMFFRYTPSKRSQFLEKQELYNPSKIPLQLHKMQKFIFPNKAQENSNLEINQINFTTFAGSTLFEFDELVNFAKYSKYFEKFLSDISEVNSVIWWSPLKNGNWKVYERLLEKEALENDYDVFVGKSGIVTYPYDDKCGMTNELLLEFHGTKKTVPLIIWSYIRPRKTDTSDEEVVILGVNSPFFEGGIDNVTMICEDMCDTIEWLEPLSRTRKMSAYGYIFCCKPNEVTNILDGFPNLNYLPPQIEQNTESNTIKRFIPTTTDIY